MCDNDIASACLISVMILILVRYLGFAGSDHHLSHEKHLVEAEVSASCFVWWMPLETHARDTLYEGCGTSHTFTPSHIIFIHYPIPYFEVAWPPQMNWWVVCSGYIWVPSLPPKIMYGLDQNTIHIILIQGFKRPIQGINEMLVWYCVSRHWICIYVSQMLSLSLIKRSFSYQKSLVENMAILLPHWLRSTMLWESPLVAEEECRGILFMALLYILTLSSCSIAVFFLSRFQDLAGSGSAHPFAYHTSCWC